MNKELEIEKSKKRDKYINLNIPFVWDISPDGSIINCKASDGTIIDDTLPKGTIVDVHGAPVENVIMRAEDRVVASMFCADDVFHITNKKKIIKCLK